MLWLISSGVSTVDCTQQLLNDQGGLIPDSLLAGDGSTLATGGLGNVSRCLYDHLVAETPMEIRWGIQRQHMLNFYFNEPMLAVDERLRLPAPPTEPPATGEGVDNMANPSLDDSIADQAAARGPNSLGLLTDAEIEMPCEPRRCYKVSPSRLSTPVPAELLRFVGPGEVVHSPL
jgi:hypothetical protein